MSLVFDISFSEAPFLVEGWREAVRTGKALVVSAFARSAAVVKTSFCYRLRWGKNIAFSPGSGPL